MRKADTTLIATYLTYSMILSVWYAVSGPLAHDEHQFMASAFMVARYNLHPYQDFPYFHMPNLVYFYAPFFFTRFPFTIARLFVGICAFGLCLTIFLTAWSLSKGHNKLNRLIVPVCSAALLIHSPLFYVASSHVWNHTSSTVCAVLSFLFHCQAIRGEKPLRYFFMSGVSLGMAIGIRLSFAPLFVPFILSGVIFRAGTVRDKLRHATSFAVGGLLANLPAVYFFLTSRDDFLFGNLEYSRLNTIYREEMSFATAMTLAQKVQYLKDVVFAEPGHFAILLLALTGFLLCGIERILGRSPLRFETLFLLLLLPFVYLGCVAPTPSFYQYYFALMPFLILLSLYSFSSLRYSLLARVAGLLLIVAAVIAVVCSCSLRGKSIVHGLMDPESWTPIRLHREAQGIRTYVDSKGRDGKVLTLAPLYAIECGLPIFKEFVTGPFAWRVAHLLPDEEAAGRGILLPTRIESFLRERRLRAILTGKEKKALELPLVREAQRLGCRPVVTPTGVVVWILPEQALEAQIAGSRGQR